MKLIRDGIIISGLLRAGKPGLFSADGKAFDAMQHDLLFFDDT